MTIDWVGLALKLGFATLGLILAVIILLRTGKKEKTMAAKEFLLIETVADKSNEVVAAIKQLGEGRIKSVDPVTGPYDVIAVIEGATLQEIGELVTGKINSIAGISRVVTCLVI